MPYPHTITCLECRQPTPLLSIDQIDTTGEAWIRLQMGCGHAPSMPARHRTSIERLAIGTSGGFTLYDPDGRPTFIVRGPRI
jgi:hypothetical protein